MDRIHSKAKSQTGELLDKCVEPKILPYLHVYLKSDRKPRSVSGLDKHSECRCYLPPGEYVQRCGIEHEYRIGRIATDKPLWFLSQALRNETIEHATPKPTDPKTPEYIFEMLNNHKHSLSEVGKLGLENLSAVAEEAPQKVSHFIVIDGEEDLPIDCLDCFQRAIWETGAFAAGWRARHPRDAMIEEYDGAGPTRHTRVRRGGPPFLV